MSAIVSITVVRYTGSGCDETHRAVDSRNIVRDAAAAPIGTSAMHYTEEIRRDIGDIDGVRVFAGDGHRHDSDIYTFPTA